MEGHRDQRLEINQYFSNHRNATRLFSTAPLCFDFHSAQSFCSIRRLIGRSGPFPDGMASRSKYLARCWLFWSSRTLARESSTIMPPNKRSLRRSWTPRRLDTS